MTARDEALLEEARSQGYLWYPYRRRSHPLLRAYFDFARLDQGFEVMAHSGNPRYGELQADDWGIRLTEEGHKRAQDLMRPWVSRALLTRKRGAGYVGSHGAFPILIRELRAAAKELVELYRDPSWTSRSRQWASRS